MTRPVSDRNAATAAAQIARRTALMLPLGLLSGCGLINGDFFSTAKKPVPGVKIPVLPPHEPLTPSAEAPPVSLPPAAPLAAWPQAGAGPRHDPGSVAVPATLREAWRAKIGAGGTYRRLLHVEPVIAGGRIFTIDGDGFADAFSVESGRRLWRQTMRPEHDNSFAFGGGLAFDQGTLYVATGFGQIRALDPASGKTLWHKPLGQPARSAPAIGGGQIYLILLDNTLLTLDVKTGDFNWRFPAGSSVNSMLGAGAPAYDQGVVVAGFGTGLLVGINAASGGAVWEQSLAAGYDADNPINVSSIVANPVIINDLVIATGVAGSTVAFDLRSGRRIWGRSGGGSQTPAAAGDWLFLLTSDQQLAAIHVPGGYVAWVTQLPAFLHPKKSSGPITWNGPLLTGNVLLLTGDDQLLLMVDAITGNVIAPPDQSLRLNGAADLPPIAAAGKLFVLTRNAILTAYS